MTQSYSLAKYYNVSGKKKLNGFTDYYNFINVKDKISL